jgi:hypothetical protein
MIPAVDRLLPEPHNGKLITLLFCLAKWHALAKLRMQTEHTLDCLGQTTIAIGRELRSFKEWTGGFNTVELPREMAARERRKSKKPTSQKPDTDASGPVSQNHPMPAGSEKKPLMKPKVRYFNLLTYKLHALGDYLETIKHFGTTDSYSTQIVSLRFFLVYTEPLISCHTGRARPSISQALLSADQQETCDPPNCETRATLCPITSCKRGSFFASKATHSPCHFLAE